MAPSASRGGGNQGLSELFTRLKFLLLALVVYRVGGHIPVPGIDPEQLRQIFGQAQGTILGLANMFSGGALERMSIFALGVMPYISASIIVQLLTSVVPSLEQLKKEGDAGRRKISRTNLLIFLLFLRKTGAVPLVWHGSRRHFLV